MNIMKKLTKVIVGLTMATTISVGAATQTLPFIGNNNVSITAEAASIKWHWCSYDIYLSHKEAQLVGRVYTILPTLAGSSMPAPVKTVVKNNAKKISSTDRGNGVRIRMTRWSPFTTNAFLTGIYAR